MNPPHQHRIRTSAGEEFAVLQWGNVGPPIMLHHATGFSGAIWGAIAKQLAAGYRVFALDARGHGDSTKNVEQISWQRFADDLVEVSRSVLADCGEARFAAAVGHSLGGTAILTAAAGQPDLFSSLFLIEPVLIPASGPGARKAGRTLFSATTRMRNTHFASRAAAREALGGVVPFRSFRGEVFEDYLAHGFADLDDGRAELKCSPGTEAAIYELGETEVMRRMVSVKVPVHLVAAARSQFMATYKSLLEREPRFDFTQVEASHLAPMEIPDILASMIRAWILEQA